MKNKYSVSRQLWIKIGMLLFVCWSIAPSLGAENRAYFWCVTQLDQEDASLAFYSKPFLADINGKSKYEHAFHIYIEAHHVRQRFKDSAECSSHTIRGEARRHRDESSLAKRDLNDKTKIIFVDCVY